MPDVRAMNALAPQWWETHRALTRQLRRCGYDPAQLAELPDTDAVCAELRAAILAFHAADTRYRAVEARTTGWRY